MDFPAQWECYRKCLCVCSGIGLTLDYSRMGCPDEFLGRMKDAVVNAFDAMAQLEKGAIANPDEKRMVGHYWLRYAALAPTADLRRDIESTVMAVKRFARAVHAGKIKPPRARRFAKLLVIGIGGSALGPQFVARALGTPKDKMQVYFFDNTDPDGMDVVLSQLAATGAGLKDVLAVVISKSGGTQETRNGMLEAEAAWRKAGLTFAAQAVAITQEGSLLDRHAVSQGWLTRFPMWDWVGGRTSETSVVGLLPAALQGLDIDHLLRGAREMDEVTRKRDLRANPAMLLAVLWHFAGDGRGAKDMVILPYRDRLELFAKYLQQLVMESLGKEKDLAGRVVHQGLAVYGNKGSTDQHAYVQQLREGLNNFFVTFIEVLRDRAGRSMEVGAGVTSGDFLSGFLQGTRQALHEKGRGSMTLTIDVLDPAAVGRLIALYERAVGFYATLVGINAYHQPGVEAGKKAAGEVIVLQEKIMAQLRAHQGRTFNAEQLAVELGEEAQVERVFLILRHLAANPEKKLKSAAGRTWFETRYGLKA